MPKIALFLVVGFIVWLFRRQSKRASPMSFGLWVAFLWVSIIASRPVGYWFANGTVAASADPMGGSFIDRNTYLFLIILGVIALARRRVNWSNVFSKSSALWIFYAFLLISVFWSDYPFIAFKRWFKDLGNVVMVLIILTDDDPVEAIRAVLMRTTYLLIIVSVLVIKWFPDLGRYYNHWTWQVAYCGITNNKNSLGDSAMVGALVLLWSIVDFSGYPRNGGKFKDVWPDLLTLAMGIWILKVAESATSVTCFVLGALIFFVVRLAWARNNLGLLGWCGLGFVLVMVAFTVLPDFRGVIAGILGRDVTLTGRTLIWEGVLKMPTNPLFGHGFASTWLSPEGIELATVEFGSAGGGALPHCHNGYLETYLDSGCIGVLLLLFVLFAAGRNAVRQLFDGTKVGCIFMALFLSGILYNYTEVAFNHSNIVGFGLWLMAAYGICAPAASQLDPSAPEPEPDPENDHASRAWMVPSIDGNH